MIELQAINKILADKDLTFLTNVGIDDSYFTSYQDEFNFIKKHFDRYKNIPDVGTFLSEFSDFEVTSVHESAQYIIDKLRENRLYNQSVPVIQKAAELFKQDANLAVDFLRENLQTLNSSYSIKGTDIVCDAKERLDELEDKSQHKENWFFSSGFKELDLLLNGIQRGEEFIVLFARTNQGKSWIAEKIAASVWEQGYNIGYFSPEMSASSIGYRFDTLTKNFSNMSLENGKSVDATYKSHIKELAKKKNKFLVTAPADFDRKPTVNKFRAWIRENGLDMIVIDGLSYVHDDRYKRGDNTTTTLTNISEDLMSLSVEMKIPIIAVIQANREAAGEEKTTAPTLETIRASDGPSHNASRAISLRTKNNTLELNIVKNRMGPVGGRLLYTWDINTGKFTYVPNAKSGLQEDIDAAKKNQEQYQDEEAVF